MAENPDGVYTGGDFDIDGTSSGRSSVESESNPIGIPEPPPLEPVEPTPVPEEEPPVEAAPDEQPPSEEVGDGGGGGGEQPGEGVDDVPVTNAKEIVPLGKADSKTLLDCDQKPFILDKMFHMGTMTRLKSAGEVDGKGSESASMTYDDYHWQLEKEFRQVPEDMSLGSVRLKPEALLYEEEHFILGKLDRDIREADGYIPTTTGRRESNPDLSEAIIISTSFPPEPAPCLLPSVDDETCSGGQDNSCSMKITTITGKVIELQYSGMTELNVESTRDDSECVPKSQPSVSPSCCGPPVTQQFPAEGSNNNASSGEASGGGNQCQASSRQCKNNMACESQIQAVCNAARKAMAIYDTLTGIDNFPCNEGDKPELEMENAEDCVWSWLYSFIVKMVPLETDENANRLASTAASPSQVNFNRSDDL